uniref:CENP-V/GFA domain-containing protein n=1 Tax=Chenopodium quinoa TaxID=63459 RepID=A0A803MUS3_CHEQI
MNSNSQLVVSHRGCHCGRIRYKFRSPQSVTAWKCNCSMCSKRGKISFSVPSHDFELILGESNITTYTFGSCTAKHTFCNICGITSFNISRSNPDAVSVNFACVDPGTIRHAEIKSFDGCNWEHSHLLQTGNSSN